MDTFPFVIIFRTVLKSFLVSRFVIGKERTLGEFTLNAT